MLEDLVKLMVERWYLPEDQVRNFIHQKFGSTEKELTLDQLRDQVSNLVQELILNQEEH